jgi:hypothetical protein
MSRISVRLDITDLSRFAKSLSKQWPESKPTHLSLMNLLAKSAGYKNFQHLKAQSESTTQSPLTPNEKRWSRLISAVGCLIRWPSKRKDQLAVLWRIYDALPEFDRWEYRQLDGWIKDQIEFGDHVLVRREMVELEMIGRTDDGRMYWKVKQEMPEEFIPFIARSRKLKA